MINIKKGEGFTLIELMVAISIIGLISSIVLVSVKSARDRARTAAGLQFSSSVHHALGAEAVGIWDFDDQTNPTKDSSGYNNHGTINGATFVIDTPSGKGYALSFNGSNYVSHGTKNVNSITGTVSGWVKPNVAYPWGFWQTHDSDGANWLDWIAMFMYDGGTFYFRMGNGGACCSNDVVFSHTNIPVGKWTHLAFTWGGSTMKIYVNGNVIASRTNAVFQSVVDSGARIGQGHSIRMNGFIDEVRIYEEALSEARIKQLYAEGLEKHNLAVEK